MAFSRPSHLAIQGDPLAAQRGGYIAGVHRQAREPLAGKRRRRARDGYAETRRQSMDDGVEAAELVEFGFAGHLLMVP